MRLLSIVGGVIVVLALSVAAFAAPQERPRCENCGMFEDTSPTRVVATFKADGKTSDHHFVCLGCIQEFNDKTWEGKAEVVGLKMLDYTTFGTKNPTLIDGTKAFYLYGTDELAGTMPPYIAAFATKDAAKQAQKTLNGEVMDFKTMWAKLVKGENGEAETGTSADSGKTVYACEMCNYESDKPGNCPHCGMTLTKKTEKAEPKSDDSATVYVCEMCNYESDKPGKCPHCGMKLEPKADSGSDNDTAAPGHSGHGSHKGPQKGGGCC